MRMHHAINDGSVTKRSFTTLRVFSAIIPVKIVIAVAHCHA